MEYERDENIALLSSCLAETKANLKNGDILVSDAILTMLRVGRILFGETRLAPMVRELLGYSDSEAKTAVEYFRSTEAEEDSFSNAFPLHRVMRGYRVPIFAVLGQLSTQSRVAVSKDLMFCDLSAREIENIVEDCLSSKAPYLVMGYEEDTTTVCMLRSSEMIQMLKCMAERVCKFIDELLEDVAAGKLTSGEGEAQAA
jgi:hypothetical protein